jgi:hypothetical protein
MGAMASSRRKPGHKAGSKLNSFPVRTEFVEVLPFLVSRASEGRTVLRQA